jgi:hypothetical protein
MRLAGVWAAVVAVALTIGLIARVCPAAAAPIADCQPYSGIACAFPFPDDRFTRADAHSETGLRVHLSPASLPVSDAGVHLRVGPYDANDGFSPGSTLVVHVPGFDSQAALDASGAAQLSDIGTSLQPAQPIEVIDEQTGRPVPIWSEIDPVGAAPDASELVIHPAGSWQEGHTYIAVLGPLKTGAGTPIPSPTWFAHLRSGQDVTRYQRPAMASYARIFSVLRRAHVALAPLYEAWAFTVGSSQSLSQRLIGMRDNAFAQLGDTDLDTQQVTGRAPNYLITSDGPVSPTVNEVEGTIQVPCYLTSCTLTSRGGFHFSSRDLNAIPTQLPGHYADVPFTCVVPDSATPTAPARISLYGHGFLSTSGDVTQASQLELASDHDMVLCSTDWLGLSYGDTGNDIGAMLNPNRLPGQVDRMQQGVLDMLYLGRLMDSPTGLAVNPDFEQSGQSVIDTSQLYYYGNSTGGIEGGIVTAISPDVTRAVLGVSSIDWANWLIPRTVGIGGFLQEMQQSYPDPSAAALMLDLMQQIWDRGDPDGYVQHLLGTRFPGTHPHAVLMQTAYGDQYVSMYSAVAEARTLGLPAYEPALDGDRTADANLLYGLPALPADATTGSVFELWDLGAGLVNPPPQLDLQPPVNVPPFTNPHEAIQYTGPAQDQISDFLAPDGSFVDVCGGQPCHTIGYTR